MKIVVITGTEVKGCTYAIKELFLAPLKVGNEITSFYLPKDMPYFCCGCKTCFFKSEAQCPHASVVAPIWEALLEADLIVLTAPVYALRTTAQMKALLDHLCVHWIVHRPEERMFTKKAVVLTNAIGVFNRSAQKDMVTSLSWLGVSDIKTLGIGLMESVLWQELSKERKAKITQKVTKLATRYKRPYEAKKGLEVSAKFKMAQVMHQQVANKEEVLSADNQHWKDKGWIK